jgi:hypothetical protein
MRARTLLAVILELLAGTAVYLGLVYWESLTPSARASPERVALALPAMLFAMIFVTFALLPLWHWLQGTQRPARFLFVGGAAWLRVTAMLLATTTGLAQTDLIIAMQLLLPGLVLVVVFGLVAKGA